MYKMYPGLILLLPYFILGFVVGYAREEKHYTSAFLAAVIGTGILAILAALLIAILPTFAPGTSLTVEAISTVRPSISYLDWVRSLIGVLLSIASGVYIGKGFKAYHLK